MHALLALSIACAHVKIYIVTVMLCMYVCVADEMIFFQFLFLYWLAPVGLLPVSICGCIFVNVLLCVCISEFMNCY